MNRRIPILAVLGLILAGLAEADDTLPPVKARAKTAQVVEVRNEGSSRVVLLSRGSRHGIKNGDRFVIVRKERRIGEVKVFAVFADICSARVTTERRRITKQDVAVLVGGGRPIRREGTVTAISVVDRRITVSLGRRDGVAMSEALDVYRGRNRVAELRVVELEDAYCRTRVVSVVVNYDGVKIGDQVRKQGRQSRLRGAVAARRLREQAETLRAKARRLEAEVSRLRKQAEQLERQASQMNPSSSTPAPRREGTRLAKFGLWVRVKEGYWGAEVLAVEKGGPCDGQAIKPGDMIFSINGKVLKSAEILQASASEASGEVKLVVAGKDSNRAITVRVK